MDGMLMGKGAVVCRFMQRHGTREYVTERALSDHLSVPKTTLSGGHNSLHACDRCHGRIRPAACRFQSAGVWPSGAPRLPATQRLARAAFDFDEYSWVCCPAAR